LNSADARILVCLGDRALGRGFLGCISGEAKGLMPIRATRTVLVLLITLCLLFLLVEWPTVGILLAAVLVLTGWLIHSMRVHRRPGR